MSDVFVDPHALTLAHVAVEDVLIELRDSRVGVLGPANGFVVREYDGSPSSVIRMGTRDGLRIAIEAYLDAVAKGDTARQVAEARAAATS